VPATLGAWYNPEAVTVPPFVVHVTDELVEPDTVTVNCCVPPGTRELVDGVIETEIGATMFSVAVADLEASATLVAVREYAPGV
jgi:hypothetical protein